MRKGVRRKGNRLEVSVRVAGALHTITFPLDTPDWQLQVWRETQRGAVPDVQLPDGQLGRDAVRYLRTVRHTPDYWNKRHYLARWVKALGRTRTRSTIHAAEIGAVLSTWLQQGLLPVTVRHHRTALSRVWTVLDGKKAPNPVKDTERPQDPEAEDRAVPVPTIRAVLAQLRTGSKTRARLQVILATGIPHAQIMQLTPADWDRAAKRLKVGRRKKGGGTASRVLPLSEAGMAALEEFAKANAWGPFSPQSMRKRVKDAAARAGVSDFRPYDARHAQGALIYEATGDLHTVKRMLGHKSLKTTERYAMSVFAAVDAAAAAKVGAQLEPELEIGENVTHSD